MTTGESARRPASSQGPRRAGADLRGWSLLKDPRQQGCRTHSGAKTGVTPVGRERQPVEVLSRYRLGDRSMDVSEAGDSVSGPKRPEQTPPCAPKAPGPGLQAKFTRWLLSLGLSVLFRLLSSRERS